MYVEWVKVGCGGVGGPRLEGIRLVGQVWASLLFQGRGNTCHDYGDVPRGPSVTSGGEEQGKVRFLACGSGRGVGTESRDCGRHSASPSPSFWGHPLLPLPPPVGSAQ